MSDIRGVVYRGQQGGFGNQDFASPMLNTLGEQIVLDWIQKAVFDGQMFQVYAGTISVPFVGDVVITDTAAEMSVDAASGTTIIPVHLNIAVNLGTGTLHEYAAKSVDAVSTVGDAFVPLPVRNDGPAAVTTARADAAGGVTVAADVTTTTRRHWAYAQPIAMGAYNGTSDVQLLPAPVLAGAVAFYLQIAATTTGPSYFASVDYVEVESALVER